MSGRRMKLKMDMPIFSTSPVDRKTLISWSGAIKDKRALRDALVAAIHTATFDKLWIDFDDARQVSSFADLVNRMQEGLPLVLRVRKDAFSFHGLTYEHIYAATVTEAAQAAIDPGLWLLMLINTWRAMIDEMAGPAIGFNFNITIAGIVATCLRLGVQVEFEAE